MVWGGMDRPTEGLCSRSVARWGYPTRSATSRPTAVPGGTRCRLEVDLPRRLGGQVHVLTTDDPREGWSWVLDEIEAGRPSLVWGDIGELPYLRVQLRDESPRYRRDRSRRGRGDRFVVDNDRAEVQEVLPRCWSARSSEVFPGNRRATAPTASSGRRAARRGGSSAAEAFRQSAAGMRRPSQPGIVDLTTAAAGPGLAAVVQLAADVRTWADLPIDDLEILLFSLSALSKAGTGGRLFPPIARRWLRGCRTPDRRLRHRSTRRLRQPLRGMGPRLHVPVSGATLMRARAAGCLWRPAGCQSWSWTWSSPWSLLQARLWLQIADSPTFPGRSVSGSLCSKATLNKECYAEHDDERPVDNCGDSAPRLEVMHGSATVRTLQPDGEREGRLVRRDRTAVRPVGQRVARLRDHRR